MKRGQVKITSLNSGGLFREPRVHSRADPPPPATIYSKRGESSLNGLLSLRLLQAGKCYPELRVSCRLLNLCELCVLCSPPATRWWTIHTYSYYHGAYFKNSTTPSWRFCNNILEYLRTENAARSSIEYLPFSAGLTITN